MYGTLDALLLSVMPVVASQRAVSLPSPTNSAPGNLVRVGLALLSSLFVTGAYHLGFPEFRGAEVVAPLIGNGVISLSYLLTSNPISPVVGHVIMHVAAVLHGLETTVQLPPHY